VRAATFLTTDDVVAFRNPRPLGGAQIDDRQSRVQFDLYGLSHE
jgi:hypothetical protein